MYLRGKGERMLRPPKRSLSLLCIGNVIGAQIMEVAGLATACNGKPGIHLVRGG